LPQKQPRAFPGFQTPCSRTSGKATLFIINQLAGWVDRDFYNLLKKEQPEFYARFKAMKDSFKT